MRRWLERLLRPTLCRVEFQPAGVRCTRGAPPARWLADCADIAREAGLEHGWLEIYEHAGALRLRTSANVAAPAAQRFRNLLGLELAGLRPPRRRR
jgi:hypothetical protein